MESNKNHIYFTEEINNKALNYVPQNIVDSYGVIFYSPSHGCIRTLDGEIIDVYFYVSTNNQEYAIIRFNYIDNSMVFDSIYLRHDKGKLFSNSKEYRYNKESDRDWETMWEG